MKRSPGETPIPLTHQWGRPPPLPCLPCQQLKRRCDRSRPCSNCRQWNLCCEYSEQKQPPQFPDNVPPSTSSRSKIRKLDEVSVRSGRSDVAPQSLEDSLQGETGLLEIRFTRLNSHSLPGLSHGLPSYASCLAAYLLPRNEARMLLNYAAQAPDAPLRMLHVPSIQALMEQTYQAMLNGQFPDHTKLLLFFALFGFATLGATYGLLHSLNTTHDQATAALKTYMHLGRTIATQSQVQPSLNALAGVWILHLLCSNESGHPVDAHLARTRGILKARAMQMQWLDTPRAREERKLKGCDVIELEVKRRLWWMMVATDWYGLCPSATLKYCHSQRTGLSHTLLNLRGLMDKEEGPTPGQTPNTSRVAVPHLIMAALTLAADTFCNPTAPDADAREVKILTAYDILENATEESCGFRLDNLCTLMCMLGNRQPPTLPRRGTSLASTDDYASPRGTPFERQSFDSLLFRGIGQEMLNERGPWSQNWPELWSEFLVVAPELDLTYWDILLMVRM